MGASNGLLASTSTVVVSGSLQLTNGINSFTGTMDVVSGGQLNLDNSSGVAVSGNLTIENGGLVTDFRGGQFSPTTVVTLSGSGQLNLSSTSGSGVSETIAGLQGASASSAVTSSLTPNTLQLAGTGTYSYAGQITDTTGGSLSLVKQGPGVQIMTGANTYSGATSVNSGALVFTQGVSNTASISTALGATLNLSNGNFSIAGTITNNGTLILGSGVTLSSTDTFTNNGTLDLRRNPSFVLPANFINNGTVLFAAPQTFAGWASSRYANVSNQAAAAVPMKDGVPNVMKFLCDIDPTHAMSAADRAGLPTFGLASNGNLTLTFRESPTQTGITVNVQTSTDMVHWTTLPQSQTLSPTTCTMQQISNDMTTNDAVMQVAVQPSGATSQFIRLGVGTQ